MDAPFSISELIVYFVAAVVVILAVGSAIINKGRK
jgi:hypothetical protein